MNDQLLQEAKNLAAQSGGTLTAVIEDALRESLARRKKPRKPKPVRLIHSGVGGLRPGVDLDHTAELLDVMEQSDADG